MLHVAMPRDTSKVETRQLRFYSTRRGCATHPQLNGQRKYKELSRTGSRCLHGTRKPMSSPAPTTGSVSQQQLPSSGRESIHSAENDRIVIDDEEDEISNSSEHKEVGGLSRKGHHSEQQQNKLNKEETPKRQAAQCNGVAVGRATRHRKTVFCRSSCCNDCVMRNGSSRGSNRFMLNVGQLAESTVLISAELKSLADCEMTGGLKQSSTQRFNSNSSELGNIRKRTVNTCETSQADNVRVNVPCGEKQAKACARSDGANNSVGRCEPYSDPELKPKSGTRFEHRSSSSEDSSPVKLLIAERPKRNLIPKRMDAISGLSWKEEANLNRALSASLHVGRHLKRSDSTCDEASNDSHDLRQNEIGQGMTGTFTRAPSFELYEDNASRGSYAVETDSRHCRVRAQRKFASCSVPASPCDGTSIRPPESAISPDLRRLIIGRRLTTDDFLTFLCIRASPELPTHLEIFKYSETDNLLCPSCPTTPTSICHVNAFERLVSAMDASESIDPAVCCDDVLNNDLGVSPLPNETPSKSSDVASTVTVNVSPEKDSDVISDASRQKTDDSEWIYSEADSVEVKQTDEGASSVTGHSARPSKPTVTSRKDTWRLDRQTINKMSRLLNMRKTCLTPGKRSLRTKGGGPGSLKCRLRESTRTVTKATDHEQLLRLCLQQSPRNSSNLNGTAGKSSGNTGRTSRSSQCSDAQVPNDSPCGDGGVLPPPSAGSGCKEEVKSADQSNSGQKRRNVSSESRHAKRQKTVDVCIADSPVEVCKKSPVIVGEVGASGSKTKCRKSLKFSGNSTSDLTLQNDKSLSHNQTPFSESLSPLSGHTVLEAPVYRPSSEQFGDLIQYIESISSEARPFGMCRIIPPADGWKLECGVSDNLRFMADIQYVHKMRDRWGPNVQATACIRRHIENQGSRMDSLPLIGGVDMDIVALLEAIQSCGGLQQVIDKNRWPKVVQMLHIPKVARDKTNRLCEIYCRQLLSYSTLTEADKLELERDVLEEKEQDDEDGNIEPCVAKGRNRSLSDFFCVARSTTSMFFDGEPTAAEVENEYWKLVNDRRQHVAVLVGHVTDETSNAAKHCSAQKGDKTMAGLQQHSKSILHHLKHPISEITLPMLDIGMLFSTNCWSRNAHFLPTINYIHTGADTIWYCIPVSQEEKFRGTLTKLVPNLLHKDSEMWLPADSVMVSPEELQHEGGVHLCRTVQQQGQFVVVFPQCFTATVGCGYYIAEHICYGTSDWMPLGCMASKMLESSCQPELFSMDELLVTLVTNGKTPKDVLRIILPHFQSLVNCELSARDQLVELGVKETKKWNWNGNQNGDRRGQLVETPSGYRCQLSKKICYLSAVTNDHRGTVYCAELAATRLQRRRNVTSYRLRCRFDDRELKDMLTDIQQRTC